LPVAQLVATELDRIVVRRRAEQEVVNEPGGWQRSILSPVVPGVNFEWIRTTLPPGCDAGVFFASASGSHEVLAVVEGALRLTIDTTTVDLKAGDSCTSRLTRRTATRTPHGSRAPTSWRH